MDNPVQLDLFSPLLTLYNKGIHHLRRLEAKQADDAFREYEDYCGGHRNLGPERDLCRFVGKLETLAPNPAELRRYANDWNRRLNAGPSGDISAEAIGAIDHVLFLRIAKLADQIPQEALAEISLEAADWYFRAGRMSEAKAWADRAEEQSGGISVRALILLGNVLYRTGRKPNARGHYLRALLLEFSPGEAEKIEDPDVRGLLRTVEDDPDVPEPRIAWAAAIGLIEGLFPLPLAPTREDFDNVVRKFGDIPDVPGLGVEQAGPAFGRALLMELFLASRGLLLRSQRLEHRRTMKQLSPTLFDRYLSRLSA